MRVIIASFFVFFLFSCGDDGTPDTGEVNLPKLSISNVTLFEGDEAQSFIFKVNSSKASESDISFDFTTKDGTAGKAIDYIESMGTLTIPAGERTVDIPIEIVTDIYKENDEEFTVVITNPVNAELSQSIGTGTIRNDDTFVDIPEDGYITPESYTGYELAWADEFNGTSINTTNWTHEIGGGGWGNNELEYYTDRAENSYISDGALVIEARKENFNGAPYTSARMITKDKRTFTHGRVDVRAILPEGQGIWPAIWMLGNNISTVGWPACGEIDIMELVGNDPSTVHGTAHWGAQGQGFSFSKGEDYKLSGGAKFSDEYHVFSILWKFGEIEWLVDDNPFFKLTISDVNGNYPFDQDFFFILNVAVGGNWPGNPDSSTSFPQRMVVDYVRIFDRI
jgi:beta-glucanase (GH16 family)